MPGQSFITEYHNHAEENESECLWEKNYVITGNFKPGKLEGKAKNCSTSDSTPSTFKIYVSITASN